MVLGAHNNYRQNARQPVNNRITIPIVELDGRTDLNHAEIQMTVPQMLEHIAVCTQKVAEFCKRGDVRAVLHRTEAGSCV